MSKLVEPRTWIDPSYLQEKTSYRIKCEEAQRRFNELIAELESGQVSGQVRKETLLGIARFWQPVEGTWHTENLLDWRNHMVARELLRIYHLEKLIVGDLRRRHERFLKAENKLIRGKPWVTRCAGINKRGAICGLPLTAEQSIRRGKGPVCYHANRK